MIIDPNQNIINYKSVLNDIITLCNGADAHCVIVGVDYNTDLSRTSYFTRQFIEYVKNENMYLCVEDIYIILLNTHTTVRALMQNL